MSDSTRAVFLSYASQDAEAARRIADALRAVGIDVWFDQSALRGGDAWDAMIRKQVKECALFVPLISANTQARSEGYFRREWSLAVNRTLDIADDQAFLLPVLTDSTAEPAARVPDRFRERQWTRVDTHDALAAFARQVARLLGGEPAATAVAVAPATAGAPTPDSDQVQPSIAVLPFANMSADAENEYFSDGLSEELVNVLAKNPALKVTGRTSSFAFKGRHEDLRVIGQKLGVATLLEGSVRKAGNRVRITAQLLKASDGFHLWSETYDRVLDDIFAVQDEIAQAVSKALDVALLGQKPMLPASAKGTGEAYDLVLQAKHFATEFTDTSLAKAIELYRQALDKRPDDARAWAGLSRAYSAQAGHGFADMTEGVRRSREAAERAVQLDDTLAEAHQNLGIVLALFEFRFAEGVEALRKARRLAPGDGNVLASLAMVEGQAGRLDEALQLSRRAVELEPLSAATRLFAARVLAWSRRYEEAGAAYRKVIEISPDGASTHSGLALVLLKLGRFAEALEEAGRERSLGYRSYALAKVHHALGDAAASQRALDALLGQGEEWAFQIASVYAFRGEPDAAFSWLTRAYELRDSGIASTAVNPYLESLHGDPRWPKLLQQIGLNAVPVPDPS